MRRAFLDDNYIYIRKKKLPNSAETAEAIMLNQADFPKVRSNESSGEQSPCKL